MKKSGLIILIGMAVNNLVTVALAQPRYSTSDVDFYNIFNMHYTSIGIPTGDSVHIYGRTSSTVSPGWCLIGSQVIPKGTISMSGNIGKTIFLTKEMVIFEESGRCDTLHFNSELPPINPRLWIRTPHSTEPESYFLSGEKNVCYYREYDETQKRFKWQISDQLNPYMFEENRTQPILNDTDGFYKLYAFIPGSGDEYLAALFKFRLSFYRYPMVHDSLRSDEILETSELNFPLPQGTITAFIYDFKYIAVVLQEQIDFYGFDKEHKKWIKEDGIPSLHFAGLYPDKK